jgi:hypothetical protein
MVLASAIPLLQQLSGINSIVFFSTKVRAGGCWDRTRALVEGPGKGRAGAGRTKEACK